MTRAFRILVVDDHADSTEMLSRLLTHTYAGCDVVAANSFQGALKAAKQDRFDLLLCDIGLPDGDGRSLLQQIKAMYSIPAIAITGHAMPTDVEQNREAGFDEQVTKPFAWDVLTAAIERIATGDSNRDCPPPPISPIRPTAA